MRRELEVVYPLINFQAEAHGRAVEVYKDSKDEYRWRLRTGNGQVIATGGESYSSKANTLGGIKTVQRDAPAAEVVEE